MGKTWDGGDISFRPELWAQVYRVLKPGAHLLAFGGTRTYHRMACAIEDAGFEIRDCVQWLYGQGFNKNGYLSYHLEVKMCERRGTDWYYRGSNEKMRREPPFRHPNADQIWGSAGALKPACELIVLARKPLSESTVAANVLKWGTGAINVEACRVAANISEPNAREHKGFGMGYHGGNGEIGAWNGALGRWPANVIHDGSEEVVGAFPSPHGAGDVCSYEHNGDYNATSYDMSGARNVSRFGDEGSAARFFYAARPDEPSADRRYTDKGSTNFGALPGARRDAVPPSRLFYTSKADGDDRLGSKHPTVKPLDLMQYLVRLITPPKGTCLDPFAGTGTTGEAAFREGMSAVLIEREAEYHDDIRRRMKLIMSGPDERARESIKQRMKDKPRDDGPLFGGTDLQKASTGWDRSHSTGVFEQSDYNADRDFSESINECYRDIRERVANGGPGWGGWPE
jgi:site-specific DNA-methyltransferase (adenine-specific)